jgi:hypothetical protein
MAFKYLRGFHYNKGIPKRTVIRGNYDYKIQINELPHKNRTVICGKENYGLGDDVCQTHSQ